MLWEHSRWIKIAWVKTVSLTQRQVEILERKTKSNYRQIKESVFALQPAVGWERKKQATRVLNELKEYCCHRKKFNLSETDISYN